MTKNQAFELKCNLGIIYGTESNMMSEEILSFIRENVPEGTPMVPIEKAAHHVLLDQPLKLAEAKTRSGKIMRRILRKIASNEIKDLGDTTTLADPSVVEELITNRENK